MCLWVEFRNYTYKYFTAKIKIISINFFMIDNLVKESEKTNVEFL